MLGLYLDSFKGVSYLEIPNYRLFKIECHPSCTYIKSFWNICFHHETLRITKTLQGVGCGSLQHAKSQQLSGVLGLA